MNNYYYQFLVKRFGGGQSWRLTDTTSYPISCTSETHKCTVCTIEFKGKTHFVEVNKDGSIEGIKDFNFLRRAIKKEEEILAEKNRIIRKNLDIGNRFEKHKFVSFTWPDYDREGILKNITLTDFSVDFQNDLMKLLKKHGEK